jgi:hypothetical protein
VVNIPPRVEVDDVKINVTLGNISEIKKVRKAIHDAILQGIKNCVLAGTTLARLIVPESAARPGRYGESYVSEKLMLTFITDLLYSLTKLSRGKQTLRKHYKIQQLWDTTYAAWVNWMPEETDWSKATSEPGFIETLDEFLRENMASYIQLELNRGGHKIGFSVT